jgi:hypothetical protein
MIKTIIADIDVPSWLELFELVDEEVSVLTLRTVETNRAGVEISS